MNIFTNRKKTVKISEPDSRYHVTYIGNIVTTFMKGGEDCVDRPTYLLWSNYQQSSEIEGGLDMQLLICATGLKVITAEQGVTEYRAHRILYCIAHPHYPRLFIWVYRHDSKKMKMDLRCHAVLCSSEAKAKIISNQLHEKLAIALSEYTREKTRRQHSRLVLPRANCISGAASSSSAVPLRIKYLSVGQNYKVPFERSQSASKLGAISEDREEESTTTAAGSRGSDSAFRTGCSPRRPATAPIITGGKKECWGRTGNESAVGAIVVTINTRGDLNDRERRRLSLDGDHQPLTYKNNNNNIIDYLDLRRRSAVSDSVLLEEGREEEGCMSYVLQEGKDIKDDSSPTFNVINLVEGATTAEDSESIESGFSEPEQYL